MSDKCTCTNCKQAAANSFVLTELIDGAMLRSVRISELEAEVTRLTAEVTRLTEKGK